MKIGIIDIGGGTKGVYSAGLYDYLIDRHITFDYYLGVSAGAANLASYLAGQRGRTANFYLDYAFRKEYMGFRDWLSDGNFFNLGYVYGTLSVEGGEDSLDVRAMKASGKEFQAVATDAMTGRPHYFGMDDFTPTDLSVFCATCCIPVACRPQRVGDRFYFDGGVSNPIPWKHALNDGVDKMVVVLNRPIDETKNVEKHLKWLRNRLRDYPVIFKRIAMRHVLYNSELDGLINLEKKGIVQRVGPDNLEGVTTLKRDKEAFAKLYNKGYDDGVKVEKFLSSIKE